MKTWCYNNRSQIKTKNMHNRLYVENIEIKEKVYKNMHVRWNVDIHQNKEN